MKLGDVSHSFFDWDQHFEFSMRVTREFYLQGDLEFNKELPISPLCDSTTHLDLAKSQIGFLEFVAMPLIDELAEVDDTGIIE